MSLTSFKTSATRALITAFALFHSFVLPPSTVLLYYDYLLTLPLEVERYWHESQLTWTTLLFLLVRYLALAGHIPVIVQVVWNGQDHTPLRNNYLSSCGPLLVYHEVYIVAAQVLVGMLLNLRTYALYGRDRRVKWLLTTVSLIAIVIGAWSISMRRAPTPWEPKGIGCNIAISTSQGRYLAIAWTGLLVFDTTIFALTLVKVPTLRRVGHRSLPDIIIRDGTVYFAFLFAANLITILTLLLGRPLIRGITSTLTNVISTSLIARLMFNIRDPTLTHCGHGLTSAVDNNTSSYGGRNVVTSVPALTDARDTEYDDWLA